MTALTAIIVDDEELARDYMAAILEGLPGIAVLDRCGSGREAIRRAQALHPDLLLLDIHMPGLSGFDTVRALQADSMPMVVFATAYDQYALQAFELHAVDYVLKPFEPERVRVAVERAMQRKRGEELSQDKARLLGAMEALGAADGRAARRPGAGDPFDRLAIRDAGETTLVDFGDIDWVDAAGDYMCVHVGDKTHVLRCTMKELERKLADTPLTRVHRSTLVNFAKVRSISSLPKGESKLHLEGGVAIKVSRSYRRRVARLKS